MAKPVFDRDRAARILVDAIALGDKTACKQWGITERTLGRYRVRLEADRGLSEAVRIIGDKADKHWRTARTQFLRKAIAKLETLIAAATPKQIRDVAEAVRVVGELDVASQVLNGSDNPDHEGSGSATSATHAGAGAGRPEDAGAVH